jgi:integrase
LRCCGGCAPDVWWSGERSCPSLRRIPPINLAYLTRGVPWQGIGADLPPIRHHDLRHGATSLSLVSGNELKTVQAMLRHSSIVFTAANYTSTLPCLAR